MASLRRSSHVAPRDAAGGPTPKGPIWLTTGEAAAHIRRKPRTLKKWRSESKGPPFVRFSDNEVRYNLDRLEEWMRGQEIFPEDGPSYRPAVVRSPRASAR